MTRTRALTLTTTTLTTATLTTATVAASLLALPSQAADSPPDTDH